jgi:hypothetical protein
MEIVWHALAEGKGLSYYVHPFHPSTITATTTNETRPHSTAQRTVVWYSTNNQGKKGKKEAVGGVCA